MARFTHLLDDVKHRPLPVSSSRPLVSKQTLTLVAIEPSLVPLDPPTRLAILCFVDPQQHRICSFERVVRADAQGEPTAFRSASDLCLTLLLRH